MPSQKWRRAGSRTRNKTENTCMGCARCERLVSNLQRHIVTLCSRGNDVQIAQHYFIGWHLVIRTKTQPKNIVPLAVTPVSSNIKPNKWVLYLTQTFLCCSHAENSWHIKNTLKSTCLCAVVYNAECVLTMPVHTPVECTHISLFLQE